LDSDLTEPVGWRTLVASLRRPYPVTFPMVALMLLVPAYIFIGGYVAKGSVYRPELAFDRALPLLPFWSLIYGALYVFLIVLPVFVVRQEEHIKRTFWAYLSVWLFAYAVFLAYPTSAPRPARVSGDGFAVWGLLALYGADPPFNCFPSLHVAHSFISALTCYRVHRNLGITAGVAATLVAVSTLFTKQHYVLDVIAGIILAFVAYWVFLRFPRDRVPALDERAAPFLAICIAGMAGLGVLGFWLVYRVIGEA
jgi:membrane-associated phospholipid phosphatase